jgi:hypothetical protein
MRRLDTELEAKLRQASRRWRWLRFGTHTGWLGTVAMLALLAAGAAVWAGWVRSPLLAGVALAVLAVGAGLAGLALTVLAAARPFSRATGSRAIEHAHPGLLDRLNTLIALEASPEEGPRSTSYFRRIERQARETVLFEDTPFPYSRRPMVRAWAACLVTAAATLWFYSRYEPWRALAFKSDAPAAAPAPVDAAAEMKPPDGDAEEVKRAWGEVRITEPGRDLKVTKVDVVPLQIEAASSDDLQRARWTTAVGGGAPKEHRLPAPAEAHYAVYQPLLYVDEFRLADWDVLSYYASAATTGGSYASEIYFLEVRPFREDILKLPGGEAGKAYQLLNEITGLVDRQKHVLRETHGHLQRPYDTPALREQDRRKLAEAEADLQEAVRHLYARIAALDHADVATVLDELARAEESLAQAKAALQGKAPPVPPEQAALSHLVASRKRLQRAISDNPEAFGDDAADDGEERSPVADPPDKQKQIAEFRNEEKAARDVLEKAAREQARLAERAKGADPTTLPELSRDQEKVRRDLEQFASEHPRVFKGAEKETADADAALRRSAEAMAQGDPGSAPAAERAKDTVDAVREAVGRRAEGRELAQAYRIREMLDTRARELEQIEKAPGEFSDEEVARRADQARQTTRELKQLVEGTSAGEAFGDPLREAVGDGPQAARERTLDALAQPQAPGGRQPAAAQGKEALKGLGAAFDHSAPRVVRETRERDALGSTGEESLNRGLQQLRGLVEADRGRPRTPEDEGKQRREALANLRKGASALYGRDRRLAQLLLHTEAEMKPATIDGSKLRKLMDEIERFRVETSEARLGKPADPGLRHLDPSRLPPAYRDRIQRYFEKLSEQ